MSRIKMTPSVIEPIIAVTVGPPHDPEAIIIGEAQDLPEPYASAQELLEHLQNTAAALGNCLHHQGMQLKSDWDARKRVVQDAKALLRRLGR